MPGSFGRRSVLPFTDATFDALEVRSRSRRFASSGHQGAAIRAVPRRVLPCPGVTASPHALRDALVPASECERLVGASTNQAAALSKLVGEKINEVTRTDMQINRWRRLMGTGAIGAALVAAGACATAQQALDQTRLGLSNLNNAVIRPEHVRGKYQLVSYGGNDLPSRQRLMTPAACPNGGEAYTTEVREGHLTLAADGSIVFDSPAILHCSTADGVAREEVVPQRMEATYFLTSGDVVRVSLPDGQRMHLAYDSAAMEIRSPELGAIWRSQAVTDASAAGRLGWARIAGAYDLYRVDGDRLPVDLSPLRGCTRQLTGGRLTLTDTGSFELVTHIAEACAGGAASSSLSYGGSYLTAEGEIRFLEGGRLGAFAGTTSARSITLPLGSLSLRFVPADRSPEPQENASTTSDLLPRAASAGPPGAYDCAKDAALAAAPPTLAADTAGVARSIATQFPGFHLATEREIACRYPLLDGSTPATYEEAFASGKAWWVQRVDVDADGVEDVVTILTADEDPQVDQLVVLFGNGRQANLGNLGGWGFSAGRDEDGAYVARVFWEKGADVYRWDGEGFREVSPTH